MPLKEIQNLGRTSPNHQINKSWGLKRTKPWQVFLTVCEWRLLCFPTAQEIFMGKGSRDTIIKMRWHEKAFKYWSFGININFHRRLRNSWTNTWTNNSKESKCFGKWGTKMSSYKYFLPPTRWVAFTRCKDKRRKERVWNWCWRWWTNVVCPVQGQYLYFRRQKINYRFNSI